MFRNLGQTLVSSIEKVSTRLEEVDCYASKSKGQLLERIKQIDVDLKDFVSGGAPDPRKLFASFEASVSRIEVMYDQLQNDFISTREKVIYDVKHNTELVTLL